MATNSTEMSPCWETASPLVTQAVSDITWDPRVRYLIFILDQNNLAHTAYHHHIYLRHILAYFSHFEKIKRDLCDHVLRAVPLTFCISRNHLAVCVSPWIFRLLRSMSCQRQVCCYVLPTATCNTVPQPTWRDMKFVKLFYRSWIPPPPPFSAGPVW
jgi:hypothetical protein